MAVVSDGQWKLIESHLPGIESAMAPTAWAGDGWIVVHWRPLWLANLPNTECEFVSETTGKVVERRVSPTRSQVVERGVRSGEVYEITVCAIPLWAKVDAFFTTQKCESACPLRDLNYRSKLPCLSPKTKQTLLISLRMESEK